MDVVNEIEVLEKNVKIVMKNAKLPTCKLFCYISCNYVII
jgi:hypothetical protein